MITFAIATAGVVAVAVLLLVIPRVLVDGDVSGRPMTAPERATAVANARAFVAQCLVGAAIILGAVATYRRLRVSEDELRAVRDGQITDRFTRAIDQLGSDSRDVRIGAIMALERVAMNSDPDREAVIATLSAFVRRRSPWPPRLSDQPAADADLATVPTLAGRADDVQIAVGALGRLSRSTDTGWVRIPETDLRRARMWGLSLPGASISGSDLREARLWDAGLAGADFGGSDLRAANLRGANLTGAVLWGADLRDADLTDARLHGAVYDASTRWPVGFDPADHGLTLITDRRTYRRARPDGY